MRIERLTRPLVSEVSRLHRQHLGEGFLASLGERFLSALYAAIDDDPRSVVVVAGGDSPASAAGFIAGTCDVAAMQRSVLRRRGLVLAASIGPRFLAPSVVRNVIRSLRYPRSSGAGGDGAQASAELLSVAVDPAYRGRHIGTALVKSLESFLREHGTTVYSVVTDADNEQSNRFYIAAGFAVQAEIVLNGRPMHRLVKSLESLPHRHVW